MSQINPLTGTIIPGSQAAPSASAERNRALRRKQNLNRNSALDGDHLDHQVESAEAIDAIHDNTDAQRQPPRRHDPAPHKKPDDEADAGESHIDVKA